MVFLANKRQHGPIALEVGTAGLRAVQLERRGQNLAVRHFWRQTVLAKPAAETEGKSVAAPEHLAATKLPPIALDGFVGNEVVVGLSPPEVECTPLRVPDSLLKLEHRALLGAIRHEVGRSISLPVEEVELDIWRLVPGHSDSPNLMVAAAPRKVIQQILAWLDEQRLRCKRIDVGPVAALRACARLADRSADDHLWGVLDFGRTTARLYIGIGQVPVYVRCVPRAGEEMTRRISEELGVSRESAESYKRYYGVQNCDGHFRTPMSTEDVVNSRRMAGILLGVVRPIIRGVGEEVQRSFRYAMGLYPDRPIAGLWLVGGGASLGGLTESLREMLGISVVRVGIESLPSELAFPPSLPDDAVPELATCLGLGFGELN